MSNRPFRGFDGHVPRKPQGGRLGKDTKPHDRQEKRTARALGRGARRTKASGSLPWEKGDVEVPQPESLLGECKTTDKRYMLIQMSWVRKINREASAVRKMPVLVFGFEGMSVPTPKDWAAVPLGVLERLLTAAGWDMEIKDE